MINLENCVEPGIPTNSSAHQTNWELFYLPIESFIHSGDKPTYFYMKGNTKFMTTFLCNISSYPNRSLQEKSIWVVAQCRMRWGAFLGTTNTILSIAYS
jgi:hypothetical protein